MELRVKSLLCVKNYNIPENTFFGVFLRVLYQISNQTLHILYKNQIIHRCSGFIHVFHCITLYTNEFDYKQSDIQKTENLNLN